MLNSLYTLAQLNLPCSEKHRRGWRRRESPAWTTKSRKNGGHKHCARTKNWTDTGKTMATASKKRGVRAALSQVSVKGPEGRRHTWGWRTGRKNMPLNCKARAESIYIGFN